MLFADDVSSRTAIDRSANREYSLLFVEHRDRVYRFAWVLCGSEHTAEEITAEVFARVLSPWRAGGVTDPLAYLRRAVLNEVRSRHRRRSHERRAIAREIAVAESTQRDGGEIDRLELREPLIAALQQLPVRQRVVVVLRFHDDLSEVEVARIVGSPVGTVKAQTSRGLATLRTIMETRS